MIDRTIFLIMLLFNPKNCNQFCRDAITRYFNNRSLNSCARCTADCDVLSFNLRFFEELLHVCYKRDTSTSEKNNKNICLLWVETVHKCRSWPELSQKKFGNNLFWASKIVPGTWLTVSRRFINTQLETERTVCEESCTKTRYWEN